MKKKNITAIFYAYSNNALDHLAPYVFLCHKKKMNCEVIFGEDFVSRKVFPNSKIVDIFKKNKISIYNIPFFEKKGFIKTVFYYVWLWTGVIEYKKYIPNYLKNKFKGLCVRLYNNIDGNIIGRNTATNLLKDKSKVFVFTDSCNSKKIKKNFLLKIKDHAKIITTTHAVWQQNSKLEKRIFTEDIALLSNKWEAASKNYLKNKQIIGSLRFSKRWIKILDHHSTKNLNTSDKKKNIIVLMSPSHVTKNWEDMSNTLAKLISIKEVNVIILPHIRGMANSKPPVELKNNWYKNLTLDSAIRNSDVVIFWGSSGIFEAVVRSKRILYLSFLDLNAKNYLWKNKISKNIIMKNENELFDAINNYKISNITDYDSFKKIIWPNKDPWINASKFLDKII
ncbi:hypothetical protein N9T58_00240 [bacterium]|nr:hypothetical protein [bacterium]